MSTVPPSASRARDDTARLGRALFYVQQQAGVAGTEVVRAKIGTVLAAGAAMDFAVRIKGHKATLTPDVVDQFALFAGVGHVQLVNLHLPMLKKAGVVDYTLADGQVVGLEEYVGLEAPMLRQVLKVLDAMGPKPVELAVLHSVEVASWAPLTRSQHLDQVIARGFDEHTATDGLKITLALGVNKKVHSAALREEVIFNPNVWASGQEDIAKFLRGLPPAERDALLGLCEQASSRPGLALPQYVGFDASVVNSAKKVGLIQAATVKSTAAGRAGAQTYVFSPVLESIDDQYTTTEALHQRKLFVAHILYGFEKAMPGRGTINSPVTLVNALHKRGTVGPATNISTDYHLVEAHGIVNVRDAGGGRAFLDAVKPEIIEGGLAWLRASFGASSVTSAGDSDAMLGRLRPPQTFDTPEAERQSVGDDMGEADEITTAAVLELRELKREAQRVVRFDF